MQKLKTSQDFSPFEQLFEIQIQKRLSPPKSVDYVCGFGSLEPQKVFEPLSQVELSTAANETRTDNRPPRVVHLFQKILLAK